MELNFNGKNIVITGAGQGIGRELCRTLYKYGANIYAFSRSEGPLKELKTECPNIVIITVDLGDWSKTIEAFKIFNQKNPIQIHGLVNNAGIAIVKPFLELTEKDLDDTLNVNFKSVFNVSQQVIPYLVEGSSIVNVSSLAGLVGFQGHSAYSASKAAMDVLTKSLALELGSKKIRVNSVNPTVVYTAMGRANWSDPVKCEPVLNSIPLHRFAELNEVVEPIIYLLSDKSSFITGHCLPIEGGYLAC